MHRKTCQVIQCFMSDLRKLREHIASCQKMMVSKSMRIDCKEGIVKRISANPKHTHTHTQTHKREPQTHTHKRISGKSNVFEVLGIDLGGLAAICAAHSGHDPPCSSLHMRGSRSVGPKHLLLLGPKQAGLIPLDSHHTSLLGRQRSWHHDLSGGFGDMSYL